MLICFNVIRGGAFANQLGSCSQFSAVSYPSVQLERTIAARYGTGASQPGGESLGGYLNGYANGYATAAGDSDATGTATTAAAGGAGGASVTTTSAATTVDDDDGAWLGSE
jgi:hypothetical protein